VSVFRHYYSIIIIASIVTFQLLILHLISGIIFKHLFIKFHNYCNACILAIFWAYRNCILMDLFYWLWLKIMNYPEFVMNVHFVLVKWSVNNSLIHFRQLVKLSI
jgi:hypothetical protein